VFIWAAPGSGINLLPVECAGPMMKPSTGAPYMETPPWKSQEFADDSALSKIFTDLLGFQAHQRIFGLKRCFSTKILISKNRVCSSIARLKVPGRSPGQPYENWAPVGQRATRLTNLRSPVALSRALS